MKTKLPRVLVATISVENFPRVYPGLKHIILRCNGLLNSILEVVSTAGKWHEEFGTYLIEIDLPNQPTTFNYGSWLLYRNKLKALLKCAWYLQEQTRTRAIAKLFDNAVSRMPPDKKLFIIEYGLHLGKDQTKKFPNELLRLIDPSETTFKSFECIDCNGLHTFMAFNPSKFSNNFWQMAKESYLRKPEMARVSYY